ncbi:MAG: DUF4956 domain-containing protein [Bacteroidales bacterium]|nr:DUF4956 domain-containing protein [Bacteroidales bacterium]
MKSIYRIIAAVTMLLFGSLALASAQVEDNTQYLPVEEELSSEEFPEFDPSIAAENGYLVEADELGNYKVESPFKAVLESILDLLKSFLFNLFICWIIVHFLYYKRNGSGAYYFTFIVFSSAMFMILFVMSSMSIQIGFTLGLFAIFGMIRYRTETIPVREMTYLFIIIALSVVNGIGNELPFLELLVANLVIVLLMLFIEFEFLEGRTSTKLVIYDRIDMITPEKRPELIEDLKKRLGLDIVKVDVGQVDFLKDSAFVKVTYRLGKKEKNDADQIVKAKEFTEDK